MSERILRALMQLFAIIAKVDEVTDPTSEAIESSNGRRIVEAFLRTELNDELLQKYIQLFDEFLLVHHQGSAKKDGQRKRTSVNSVKVLRICAQINEELTQRQKMIVLLRIFDFIHANDQVHEQEQEFVHTVSESFNIPNFEYLQLKSFIESNSRTIMDDDHFMYVNDQTIDLKNAKQIKVDGLEGSILVIRLESVNILFFKYFGQDELILNGQIVSNERRHILNQGSSLRTNKSTPIYYSDVISRFLNDANQEKITFKVDHLQFHFNSGKIGLHEINFMEQSGKLIGVMGGSGAGKSTFLNVLNGNYIPSHGAVTINGVDLHREKSKLEGVIGFVSQDDLLIEELTVFQNLYFNAKLCFNDLSEQQLKKKVLDLLSDIGLGEAKNLKVGSPLEKTISGGQRKRLNIALELIRQPAVMFVDEPTSGLSSRDSENIMDMLKELALKGKLIFVVIHQPSSDIFKMFDKLMILDQGGYPIFDGNPIDAVVYFKTHVHHVNANERECPICGNVNPEQIFNIIESKVVDEYGNQTKVRKVTPREWNERYLSNFKTSDIEEIIEPVKGTSRIANKLRQFKVFFLRDVLSKLANKQYMFINMLEAPVLAAILSFFVKFFNSDGKGNQDYVFYQNENIPQYLFISVVVALFLGLTVAAEEIIKDKKILKRESFLNLSLGSYLWSKILIMFMVSAIQTACFVFIGNLILEIHGLWWEYWVILFSTSCMANVLGLNISSAFNSAKVIYIIVPLLIIPQLIFSGVIVKFDKLHPIISSNNEVPWVGNAMASRWAYEALAVVQSTENAHEEGQFKLHQKQSNASWKRDYWIPEMKNQLTILADKKSNEKDFEKAKRILTNEVEKEVSIWDNLECKDCIEGLNKLQKGKTSVQEVQFNIGSFLEMLKKQYNINYNETTEELDKLVLKVGEKHFEASQAQNVNESLQDLVTNRTEVQKIIVTDDELLQKDDPIYIDPKNTRLLNAPFYTSKKYWFGIPMSTFLANILVLWGMTVLMIVALYYDLLRKFLGLFSKGSSKNNA
ncbi:ATP-binding cassette domain-containing protein [Fluviicola taffensis]|uniref:ABC transporter related protein n=1 Tax=Fluviicola taffensis (strain DSM 16823 / NCIMB 13979 / RW262) TaxID=755732 RepID=F2IDB2_FLUTR|nr:ATP-binding cassette domain-containing protein [Fluviicola taffensis]AEA45527.1 ABC transporter related protein [Fluviicola taffensis DSM 16823]